MSNLLFTVATYALPVILAITLHEAAHAYMARWWGDNTAYALGRMSINPLVHIDLYGTVLIPGLIVLTSFLLNVPPMLFGWAKPVPVQISRTRNVRSAMRWVAFAGPAANLAMAMAWATMFKTLTLVNENIALDNFALRFLSEMAYAGIVVNLMLAWFNLLPILPLDGGRILTSFLPARASLVYWLEFMEQWGLIIVLMLSLMGILALWMGPLVGLSFSLIAAIFNF